MTCVDVIDMGQRVKSFAGTDPYLAHEVSLVFQSGEVNEASGDTRLIQLKGRWTIDRKYIGRDIWIAFPDRGCWYVAPHDEMMRLGERHTMTESWARGTYSKSPLSKTDCEELADYRFGDPDLVIAEAEKLERMDDA